MSTWTSSGTGQLHVQLMHTSNDDHHVESKTYIMSFKETKILAQKTLNCKTSKRKGLAVFQYPFQKQSKAVTYKPNLFRNFLKIKMFGKA